MRLAIALLALALLAPLASAGPDLRLPDPLDPDTDAACDVVVPENPGRGVVCAVAMAFCVTNALIQQPCPA